MRPPKRWLTNDYSGVEPEEGEYCTIELIRRDWQCMDYPPVLTIDIDRDFEIVGSDWIDDQTGEPEPNPPRYVLNAARRRARQLFREWDKAHR